MIKEIKHPIIQNKLTLLRRKDTPSKDFRDAVEEIATFLTYEVARDFGLREIEIETPLTRCNSKILADDFIIVQLVILAWFVTKPLTLRLNTIKNCRQISPVKKFWLLTQCWRRAAVQRRLFKCSKTAALKTLFLSA